MLTVRLQLDGSKVRFETVDTAERPRGKMIFEWAPSIDDAKRKVVQYAKCPVTFVD